MLISEILKDNESTRQMSYKQMQCVMATSIIAKQCLLDVVYLLEFLPESKPVLGIRLLQVSNNQLTLKQQNSYATTVKPKHYQYARNKTSICDKTGEISNKQLQDTYLHSLIGVSFSLVYVGQCLERIWNLWSYRKKYNTL